MILNKRIRYVRILKRTRKESFFMHTGTQRKIVSIR